MRAWIKARAELIVLSAIALAAIGALEVWMFYVATAPKH